MIKTHEVTQGGADELPRHIGIYLGFAKGPEAPGGLRGPMAVSKEIVLTLDLATLLALGAHWPQTGPQIAIGAPEPS